VLNQEKVLIELLMKIQDTGAYSPALGVNEAGFLEVVFTVPPELAKEKNISIRFYVASDEAGESLETILSYALGLLTGQNRIPENMRHVEPPEDRGGC